ncbi:Extracellular lipase [Aspergillus sp. HF37]|nr:Extracellular lipase [Aspergillus sp. HF37]
MFSNSVWSILLIAAQVAAAPARPVARGTILLDSNPTRSDLADVSANVLQQLTLFAEYSTATYCSSNLQSTGNSLTCAAGNCPTVEAASTKTLYEFENQADYGDVAGYVAADSTNKLLVVAFRGTTSADTWIANLNFAADDIDSVCSGCEAHGGFWQAWGSVADTLTAEIESAAKEYPDYTLVFTGHSFGGAMATLGATVLRNAGHTIELYTYGSPRVGNTALAEYITAQGSLFRVTHTDDIVPNLPPTTFGFSHPSPEYWITSDNGETVTTSDIQVVKGIDSTEGNAGTVWIDGTAAHGWYIIQMGC